MTKVMDTLKFTLCVCVLASALSPTAALAQDKFALARTTSSGALDTSFGANGRAVIDFASSPSEFCLDATLAPGGKIVAVGNAWRSDGKRLFALARFNANGTLDTTFDQDGKVLTEFDTDAFAHSVAIDASGKIVVAGSVGSAVALTRYNTNGSLDLTFGSLGTVLVRWSDEGFGSQGAVDMAIAANGAITIVRRIFNDDGDRFGLMRFHADGALDASFGTGGKVFAKFPGYAEVEPESMALDWDGKIVVAGTIRGIGASSIMGIARYNTNGTLDTSYGAGGAVVIAMPSAEQSDASSVLVDGANRVVVGGRADGYFALARTTASGRLDSTFGVGGKVVTNFASRDYEGIDEIAFSGSRIVAFGNALLPGEEVPGGDFEFAAARYLSNGSLDNTFDGDGKVLTGLKGVVFGGVVDGSGRMTAAGFTWP